jgi:hypothetical protein
MFPKPSAVTDAHVDEKIIRRYTHLQAEDCRADPITALAVSNRVPTVSPTVAKRKKKSASGIVQ